MGNGIEATIFQTESRPALEGRQQARILLRLGLEVNLIVDSAVSRVLPNMDLVLLGADHVTLNYFVNKIGSCAIALACQHFKVPVYVLADSRKFIATGKVPDEPLKREEEVWEDAPKGVVIPNYYFESVPNDLVDAFVTETGLKTPGDLLQQFPGKNE